MYWIPTYVIHKVRLKTKPVKCSTLAIARTWKKMKARFYKNSSVVRYNTIFIYLLLFVHTSQRSVLGTRKGKKISILTRPRPSLAADRVTQSLNVGRFHHYSNSTRWVLNCGESSGKARRRYRKKLQHPLHVLNLIVYKRAIYARLFTYAASSRDVMKEEHEARYHYQWNSRSREPSTWKQNTPDKQ